MYLHLSETTIKTLLGTILKKSVNNFSYIQYLVYLELIFTSLINFFKNILVPDFSTYAMFLYF